MATLDDVSIPLSSLAEAVQFREQARSRGESFVLTNGCFDLLHAGHVYSLEQAAALGDHLWVALNSDVGVKALKGASRPVQSERERAYALTSLRFVSGVTLFGNERLVEEIEALRPDHYAKSGDYTTETMDQAERAALEACGAEIHFLSFLEGQGTTGLLAKIKSLPEG